MGHEQLRGDELVAQKKKTVINDQLTLTFRDGGSWTWNIFQDHCIDWSFQLLRIETVVVELHKWIVHVFHAATQKKNMSGPILSCLKCHYLAFTKFIIFVRTVGVKFFTHSCWHFTVLSSKQLVYKRPSAFKASCNIRISPVWQICNKSTYRMHRERVEYPFSWLTIVCCRHAGLGVTRQQINA